MPTFTEISQKYAARIIAARDADRLIKKSDLVSESLRKRTHLATALVEIARDLDTYTIDNVRLTPAHRTQILEGAARIIGMGQPVNFSHMVKAASNDDFTSLGDGWDDFFTDKK